MTDTLAVALSGDTFETLMMWLPYPPGALDPIGQYHEVVSGAGFPMALRRIAVWVG
jgi:hypothetical protein